jgi:hypothetical protein
MGNARFTAKFDLSEAARVLRCLIEEICVTPDGDGNTVELAGGLATLLHLGGSKTAVFVKEGTRSELLVAGT